MCRNPIFLGLLLTTALQAQLIPAGSPIPKTVKPPVVFLNGYQTSCPSTNQFANSFGMFDQFLQATGRTTVLFDNCLYPNKPSIELLGNDFRTFLGTLKYTDGTPVTQVDLVGHSMGGLIIRSYLAGKQPSEGVFQPPTPTMIRKAVFLATPNFGSPIANLFGLDAQVTELAEGSLFTFDLAIWNQDSDDLRGVDAMALVGNGGNGVTVSPGLDDGVVATTSASIGFAEPGRTRIIPYCHTNDTLVVALCNLNATSIATGRSAMDSNVVAVLSFLNDTADWQSIGQSPQQNSLLSTGGGLAVRAKTSSDQYTTIQDPKTQTKTLNLNGNNVAYTDLLPAQATMLSITTPAISAMPLSGTTASPIVTASFTLPAGYYTALIVKPGPLIGRVIPSAAYLNPLAVAPGELLSIFGTNFDGGNLQVTFNGVPLAVSFSNASQINTILPDSASTGLQTVTVSTNAGTHTVNVLVGSAVPAIFTQDQSGTGPAAALNAVTNALVTSSAPLHVGDYLELFLTGLGPVSSQNGLQIAQTVPTVTVGGANCPVSYAGRAPGFPGLDQIDCQIASGTPVSLTSNVVVSSAGFNSNVATVAIQ